jgi:hypothetical protein
LFRINVFGSDLEARDCLPLLRWLLLTVVSLFGLWSAWYYGYLQFMVSNDRSHITIVILGLYAVFSLHCMLLTVKVSLDTNSLHDVQTLISNGNIEYGLRGDDVVISQDRVLKKCVTTGHIHNLVTMASLQGATRLDQTILLRRLADSLRYRQSVGWFVADAMLKLGLLGTVIGFILMLSSIQSIDSFDVDTLKGALIAMSSGMGIALFTTLFGLVGGILLKLQYYILDDATSYLFGLTTELTEVYVVPTLNRRG